MHSDIDGFTCLVSDCLFRVHQSWGESRENLVSHILWRVAAASDSQAVGSEWGRERSAGGSIVGHVQLHCNISAGELCLKQRDG